MSSQIGLLASEYATPLDTLYVADSELNVIWSDRNWHRFAQENGGEKLLADDWSGKLLDQFSGAARTRWEQIYKALLDGRMQQHRERIPCPSPDKRRFYDLEVRTAQADDGSPVILHRLSPADVDSARQTLEDLAQTLDEMRPAGAIEAYRSLVGRRSINLAGNDVARYLKPLDEVGGDFVWTFSHPDGTTDLVVGDAMGHGTGAAQTAMWVIACFAAESSLKRDLPDLIDRVNTAFFSHDDTMSSGGYATGIVLRFEPGDDQVRGISFGHNNPIMSRAGIINLEGGMPVGLVPGSTGWTDMSLSFEEHGYSLLLYTDGITEQFDASGEMFGEERLAASFLRHIDSTMEEALQGITDDLHAFADGTMQKDDQTILGVRFKR